MKALLMQKER